MRVVPILNAVGCLILSGVIFFQWVTNTHLEHERNEAIKRGNVEAEGRVKAETRGRNLENDIGGLKAVIESVQEASNVAAKQLEERTKEADALGAGLVQAQEALKTWEEGIKVRDAKIAELNSALVATRGRLDEAIAKLKEAGAR